MVVVGTKAGTCLDAAGGIKTLSLIGQPMSQNIAPPRTFQNNVALKIKKKWTGQVMTALHIVQREPIGIFCACKIRR